MSDQVRRIYEITERVVQFNQRSQEDGHTMRISSSEKSLTSPQDQGQLPLYHANRGSRDLENGPITADANLTDSTSESTTRAKVSLARLHSDIQQVGSPRLRASFQVPDHGPLQCFHDCSCRCHYRAVIRSPRYLSNYLGDFFLGASNLPWCFSTLVQCNEQTCRRSKGPSAHLRYFFPSWFSASIASFSASFTLKMLPLNICLQTRHTIPYDSPILVSVQEGNINEIRTLIRSGEASLNDVDPYGLGLLYVGDISQLSYLTVCSPMS